jgi:SSS family solute:Na+ symporter
MLAGFVLGALRLVLELVHGKGKNVFAEGSVWKWLAEINFLHFAAMLFVFCSALLVIVSLLTRAPSASQLAGLTLWTTDSVKPAPSTGLAISAGETGVFRRRLNIALSLVLIGILVVLWTIFA